MTDIFQARGALGGIFKGTTAALTLGQGGAGGSTGEKGALVQSISLTYTRNVTRVWELGSHDTYYVIGHTEGQAQLTKIISKAESDFLDQLADPCASKDRTLMMGGITNTCENGAAQFGLVATGPMLTQRTFSVSADQFVISASAALMFVTLRKA